MPNFLDLTSDDLVDAYEGNIEISQVAWVERITDKAARELLAMIPSMPARIESGALDKELVKDKVIDAVLRVVRNPMGIDSEGEGDYNIKLRNTVASGDVWYQEKDLLQLGWIAPKGRDRPRTVHARATPGWGFPS